MMYEALRRGLNLQVTPGNVLDLAPALVITREDMELALAVLDGSIGAVEAQAGYAALPSS